MGKDLVKESVMRKTTLILINLLSKGGDCCYVNCSYQFGKSRKVLLTCDDKTQSNPFASSKIKFLQRGHVF